MRKDKSQKVEGSLTWHWQLCLSEPRGKRGPPLIIGRSGGTDDPTMVAKMIRGFSKTRPKRS